MQILPTVTLLKRLSGWDWFALILPALALSPLLFIECIALWGKEHLQFFPLAFAAAAYFLYEEGKSDAGNPSEQRILLGFVGTATSILLSGMAVFLVSPWLAHFSLVALILFWGIRRLSNLTILRIVGICGLLLVTVPAPGGLDKKLVQSLQAFSSNTCSLLMDETNILHVKRGNIIELASKPLFVEEACSGVDSQYALMAVAGVMLLIGRAGLFVSLLTVVTVPIWAILGNLLRIYSIVIGLEWLNVDLSSGMVHTVLGLIVFAAAAYAHWSSVQFLNYLELRYFQATKSSADPNPVQGVGTLEIKNGKSTPALVRALATLLVLFTPVSAFELFQYLRKDLPNLSREVIAQFPSDKDLPKVVLGQIKSSFSAPSRGRTDLLGQHSRVWQYLGENGQQTASLDFPFRGWHPLWECYLAAGWTRDESTKIETDSTGKPLSFPFFESHLRNQEGQYAILHFSLFDENGMPFGFDGSHEQLKPTNRLSSSLLNIYEHFREGLVPLTFQFQLLTTTNEKATADQIAIYRKMYLELREKVYSKSMPAITNLRRQH